VNKHRRPTVCRGSVVPPAVLADLRLLSRIAKEAQRHPIEPSPPLPVEQVRRQDRYDVPGRATAAAFGDWVFWQRNPHYQPLQRGRSTTRMLWSGQYGHAQIERLRLWLLRDRNAARLVSTTDWELVYADPPDKAAQHVFRASCLIVDGQELTGRPDVVLRSTVSGGVIVLERKVLHRDEQAIPKDGFANHWCQLWCYGWMDAWADAPYVMLALQYWRRHWQQSTWAKVHGLAPVRFCRSPGFEAWARRWFEKYGGSICPRNSS
jgi:hypothetical protein